RSSSRSSRGKELLTAGRDGRRRGPAVPKSLRSQEVNRIVCLLLGAVRDTMKKSLPPARRPDAGAGPALGASGRVAAPKGKAPSAEKPARQIRTSRPPPAARVLGLSGRRSL